MTVPLGRFRERRRPLREQSADIPVLLQHTAEGRSQEASLVNIFSFSYRVGSYEWDKLSRSAVVEGYQNTFVRMHVRS